MDVFTDWITVGFEQRKSYSDVSLIPTGLPMDW